MTIRTRDFSFKGRNLTVKAGPFTDGWKVRVFENGLPVTAIVYSVSHETLMDASMTISTNLVEHLMATAQDDVERGRVRLVEPSR